MDRIRTVTWLAPGLPLSLFERVCNTLQAQLGIPVLLESRTKLSGPSIGSSEPFATNQADLGFLCGPAAVPASVRSDGGFELLELAPLFDDVRYHGKPTCFCDLVVRQDCTARSLQDLHSTIFGFNDTNSLSGWLGLAFALSKQQININGFFGSVIHTGGHLHSLNAIREGSIDVASIDSNVLRAHRGMLNGLKVIDSVGPWPSQPVVIRSTIEQKIKSQIRDALEECGPWPDLGFVGFRHQSPEDLSRVPSAKAPLY